MPRRIGSIEDLDVARRDISSLNKTIVESIQAGNAARAEVVRLRGVIARLEDNVVNSEVQVERLKAERNELQNEVFRIESVIEKAARF